MMTLGHAAPPRVILFVLADDIGSASQGFVPNSPARTQGPNRTSLTPHLDALAAEGTVLMRHTAHFMCTPSRVALLSGRLPVYVQQGQDSIETPTAGMPRNMTAFPEKLFSAGYATHYAGKYDLGISTPGHTPEARGFRNSSLMFNEHMVDSWTQRIYPGGTSCTLIDPNIVDLWSNGGPAMSLNGTDHIERMFSDRVLSILNSSSAEENIFVMWAPKALHYPLMVPQSEFEAVGALPDDEPFCNATAPYIWPGQSTGYACRQQGFALLRMMDNSLGQMVGLLKSRGWWNSSLVIFSSDNGAALDVAEAGSSSWPLKGGKYSNWNGGINVPAIVSGGYLPARARGTLNNGLVHIADWYATLLGLAGVNDTTDHRAAASHLPPINSIDVWHLISGANATSPRIEIPVSPGALISWPWKLVRGLNWWSGRAGPTFPNASSAVDSPDIWTDCGDGCLFDLENDWEERTDLASTQPATVAALGDRLTNLTASFWTNNDTGVDICPKNTTMWCGCWAAINVYGGYFGPYQK